MSRRFLCAAVASAFAFGGGSASAAVTPCVQNAGTSISDCGFESSQQGAGGYSYTPAGSGWTFGFPAGVSANGSPYTSSNVSAPEGQQVGFVQYFNGSLGSATQSVSGWRAGTNYKLTVSAVGRAAQTAGTSSFALLLDGQQIGTTQTVSAGGAYQDVSFSFTTTAGTHTLAFQARQVGANGDTTMMLDNIRLTEADLVGRWNFASGSTADTTGNWSSFALHGATVSGAGLAVTGTANGSSASSNNWAAAGGYTGPTITDKTLVAWVKLDDRAVRGGSPLSLYKPAPDGQDSFDAIDWAENNVSQWMAGSEFFRRTTPFNIGAVDTMDATVLRQIAISYKTAGSNVTITGCLNGVNLGTYTQQTPIASFGSSENPLALFGPRHLVLSSGSSPTGGMSAHISEARIYSRALTCSEAAAADAAPAVVTGPANVSALLGSSTAATGRFTGSGLTITSSIGTVTSQWDGSYTWSYTPSVATAASTPVTITATDTTGRTATSTFTLTIPATTITVPTCLPRYASGAIAPFSISWTNLANSENTRNSYYLDVERVRGSTPGDPLAGTRLVAQGATFAHSTSWFGDINSQYGGQTVVPGETVWVNAKISVHYGTVVLEKAVTVCFDTTPPVETATVTGTPGAFGWYTGNVGITWATSDVESIITSTSGCGAQSLTTDTVGTSYTCSATSAGGTSSSTVSVKRDATPPVLSVPAAPVVAAATSSSGSPVTYAATASDATSGAGTVVCAPLSGSVFAIGNTSVTCNTQDLAGNKATASFTVRVADVTAPVLAAHGPMVAEATGPAGATIAFTAPAATDAVDGAVPAVCSPGSGSLFAVATTTVTCTATDAAHNSAATSFAVTVQDTTAPVLTVAPNQDAEATSPQGATVSFTAATAADLVDGVVPATCDHASGETFALGVTTVSCQAIDAHGNRTRRSFVLTVADTIAPVTTDDAPTGWQNRDTTMRLTAVDGGSGIASVRYAVDGAAEQTGTSVVIPAAGNDGVHTIRYHAIDARGNSEAEKSATVRIDATAPVLHLPAAVRQTAQGSRSATIVYLASATDSRTGDVAADCSPASGSSFAMHDTTVRCSATDDAGNVAQGSFVVTVADDSPPTISRTIIGDFHADVDWYSSDVSVSWLVGDAESDVTTSGCDPAAVAETAGVAFTCSASSEGGTSVDGPLTLRVDKTPPTVLISHAPNGDNGWDRTRPAVAASASDGTGSGVASGPSCLEVLGGLSVGSDWAPGDGTYAVRCAATDRVGWTGVALADVRVDAAAPALDVSHVADGLGGWNVRDAVDLNVVSSDATSGVFASSCIDALSGSDVFGQPVSGDGVHAISCVVRDAAGNSSAASDTVRIDTIAPTATVNHQGRPSGWNGASPVALELAASDHGSGVDEAQPTCTDSLGGLTGSHVTGEGVHTVSCVAVDRAGNRSATVADAVMIDTIDPRLAVSHASNDAGWNRGDVTLGIVSSDEGSGVDGAPACTDNGQPLADRTVTGDGDHAIRCTVSDVVGHEAIATDTVWIDTQRPAISVPADTTAEATGAGGAAVDFAPTAADGAGSGAGPVSCSSHGVSVGSGDTFALGDHVVTCSATDAADNTGSASFTITVLDRTAPAVGRHADLTTEATAASGAPVEFEAPTAHDVVDGSVAVTCAPASGSTFALGITTVKCSATDGAGNTGTSTFEVQVQDTTAPVIADHPGVRKEATGADGAVVSFGRPAASDLVDGDMTAACDPASGSTFRLGSSTVTCSVTDSHGNKATSSFIVEVVDTTAPDVRVADKTVEATDRTGAEVNLGATATDIVDGTLAASCVPASGSVFALDRNTLVTCTAKDRHDNTGTATAHIRVVDTTSPAIDAHTPVTAEATGGDGAKVSYDAPATSDAVDGAGVAKCSPTSGSTFALGQTTVKCIATDVHHNASTSEFTVTVRDTTAPVVTAPSDASREATSSNGAAVTWPDATAKDVVDGSSTASCLPASGSTFPVGIRTVTCTKTDRAGNTGTASFKVTVTDTTKPTLTVPAVTFAEATGANSTKVKIDAVATDIVDGSIPVICTPASGSVFSLGSTAITCTATDSHGNTTTKTASVLVYRWATDAHGAFVISDKQAVQGGSVTFWGSQWEKVNPFSSGLTGASSFKGFIEAPSSGAVPAVGATWTSGNGNSTNPPATVPAYMAVVVASKETKTSGVIGGDVKRIAIVRTDAGYEGNPGHAGTGTVVGLIG
ncbi:MAG: HYR domain-containing protein [Solirubrobacteraceae bacterium]